MLRPLSSPSPGASAVFSISLGSNLAITWPSDLLSDSDIASWKPAGERPRGRPSLRLSDVVSKDLGLKLTMEGLMELANDRDR